MSTSVHVCPQCSHKLRPLIFGDIEESLSSSEYISMGCICFGDDRDGAFLCENCNTTFSQEYEPIKLITCPLEASNAILACECKRYDYLRTKPGYTLLNDTEKVCSMICPKLGKEATITLMDGTQIEGQLIRTFVSTVSAPFNHLSVSQKKDKYHRTFIDIPIDRIKCIK